MAAVLSIHVGAVGSLLEARRLRVALVAKLLATGIAIEDLRKLGPREQHALIRKALLELEKEDQVRRTVPVGDLDLIGSRGYRR